MRAATKVGQEKNVQKQIFTISALIDREIGARDEAGYFSRSPVRVCGYFNVKNDSRLRLLRRCCALVDSTPRGQYHHPGVL